jgi:hypothetical protein
LPKDCRSTLGLFINGYQTRLTTVVELNRELQSFANEAFREISINVKNGPALCALLNRGIGWLMYVTESADGGFSSRNPNYEGEVDAMLEYRLSNGQHDTYPASWALPENRVIEALEYFVKYQQRVPFIQWHDNSA